MASFLYKGVNLFHRSEMRHKVRAIGWAYEFMHITPESMNRRSFGRSEGAILTCIVSLHMPIAERFDAAIRQGFRAALIFRFTFAGAGTQWLAASSLESLACAEWIFHERLSAAATVDSNEYGHHYARDKQRWQALPTLMASASQEAVSLPQWLAQSLHWRRNVISICC